MTQPSRSHVSDLLGASRLAVEAIAGATDLVETMHHVIARAPGILGPPVPGATCGISGLVYGSIRAVTWLVGAGIEGALAPLAPLLRHENSSPRREAALAVLNGIVGDHLAATENPLAIPMRLRRRGQPLELNRRDLAAAIRLPRRKLLVLVHGACRNDLQWRRLGHDHGAALSRALGYTPVYLHYNSGLHVSTNGRAFAALLEALVEEWPVEIEDLVLIGHSMGGLVSRSAFHYGAAAGHRWVRESRKLVFLGTPHHGAPLERGGNWVNAVLDMSPYTAAFARLGRIRSAGVTDLRFGSLLDEDWQGRDRFEHAEDYRQPVPLPQGVHCYAIAATKPSKHVGVGGPLLGDGIIPLDSALGRHRDPARALSFPTSRQWVATGVTHLGLLSRREVYETLRRWLAS